MAWLRMSERAHGRGSSETSFEGGRISFFFPFVLGGKCQFFFGILAGGSRILITAIHKKEKK